MKPTISYPTVIRVRRARVEAKAAAAPEQHKPTAIAAPRPSHPSIRYQVLSEFRAQAQRRAR